MTFKLVAEAMVKSPDGGKPRRGRGFTGGELEQAGLDARAARGMGLIVDLRRRTVHAENVEILKQYAKDLDNAASSAAEEKVSTAGKEEVVTELASLSGLREGETEALLKAGVKTVSELAYCDIAKVAKKSGLTEQRLKTLVKAALKKV